VVNYAAEVYSCFPAVRHALDNRGFLVGRLDPIYRPRSPTYPCAASINVCSLAEAVLGNALMHFPSKKMLWLINTVINILLLLVYVVIGSIIKHRLDTAVLRLKLGDSKLIKLQSFIFTLRAILVSRTRDWSACVKFHAADYTQFRVSVFFGLRDGIDNR
jgi:hypothetical protein